MAASSGKRRMLLPALPRLARLPAPLAALVVGGICGALVVALVFSGERGCDAVAGSPSCGGVGLLMLAVVLVGAYAVGVLLLRLFSVDQAGLTAFFGIMLPLVVVLAFLTDAVFSTSMALILPALSACGFAVGSVFTAALGNSDEGSGWVRPQAQEKSHPADTTDQPLSPGLPAPPELSRYAPQREPVVDDDATQPLVVGERSAQDETTMLTATEEPQTLEPEPTQPEPTDSPAGEPEQPQREAADPPSSPPRHLEAEPNDPEVNGPQTDTGAGDKDEDAGDQDRPSPWRRA